MNHIQYWFCKYQASNGKILYQMHGCLVLETNVHSNSCHRPGFHLLIIYLNTFANNILSCALQPRNGIKFFIGIIHDNPLRLLHSGFKNFTDLSNSECAKKHIAILVVYFN